MRAKIIAVDFDGTLIEENKWPGIGAANEKVLGYCKDEQAKGTRIILWTNRIGEPLEAAIKWCEEHGLNLDAVNDNLPESVEFFGTNTRKIYADEFIDDRMAKDFDLPYSTEKLMVPPVKCRKQIIIKTDSGEEEFATAEKIHNLLVDNPDYIASRIVLNMSADRDDGTSNEVHLYIFDDSLTDVELHMVPSFNPSRYGHPEHKENQ